jgi:hypothetical protein
MYVTHVYILYGFLLTGTPVEARVGGKEPSRVLTLEEGRCKGHGGERQEECKGYCGQHNDRVGLLILERWFLGSGYKGI